MSVPLSTSSSNVNERIESFAWKRVIVCALLLSGAFVVWMEWALWDKGFRATVIDTDDSWVYERRRAAEGNPDAMIIIGASRALLDVSPKSIASGGYSPIQLAIDGSSYIPVLQDLSDDPKVRDAKILVSYQDSFLVHDVSEEVPRRFISQYRQEKSEFWITSDVIEKHLERYLHWGFRSYADGARPISSLLIRILNPQASPQYLATLPGRFIDADYKRVPMPAFYYGRVARNLQVDLSVLKHVSRSDLPAYFSKKITELNVIEPIGVGTRIQEINLALDKLKQRNVEVIFVVFPSSGMVREIEKKRYPRALYWEPFAKNIHAETIHFEDWPELRAFQCPDGSHLDYRDKEKFTTALLDVLNKSKTSRQPGR